MIKNSQNDKEEVDTKTENSKVIVKNTDLESALEIEDFENRIIHINSDIDDDVLFSVTDLILRYNRYDLVVQSKDRNPIIIYINSSGGDKFAGLGIVDAIIESQTPVYTVNIGACMSMAALIFLAGEKRYSFRHSTFLLHDGEIAINSAALKVKCATKFMCDDMLKVDMDLLLDRTNIDKKTFNKKYAGEWYFFGEEAKKLGVVTDVIGVDCKMTDIV